VAFHAIELGAPAARAYEEAVHAAAAAAQIDATITVEARDFRTVEPPPACDLILCQTALNELLVGERHAAATVDLVAGWARTAPLLVIEPALRTTTRALMLLRDALLTRGDMHVVAPCPHQKPCPMLPREGDWCHEARRIEPTPRVARIDRIVGRRDERALFAFLATAPGALAPAKPESLVRLVTDPLGSRGKTERLVCRDDGDMRLMRLLDRELRDGNRDFLDAERGALVRIEPMPPNDRISPGADVRQEPHA
jgi:ribosomal protein RSM22 (predicted rRNA methylase)